MYLGGAKCIEHADLENSSQTVHVLDVPAKTAGPAVTESNAPQSGQALPKTGDHIAIGAIAACIALAMSCAALVLISIRRRWGNATLSNEKDARR